MAGKLKGAMQQKTPNGSSRHSSSIPSAIWEVW